MTVKLYMCLGLYSFLVLEFYSITCILTHRPFTNHLVHNVWSVDALNQPSEKLVSTLWFRAMALVIILAVDDSAIYLAKLTLQLSSIIHK